MTVQQLIERLALEDPKTRVVVEGYEQGYDEVHEFQYTHIALNTDPDRPWWDGELNSTTNKEAEIALVFPRGKSFKTK